MSDIRKRQLAQIHIAAKELAMDKDSYRMLLKDVTGKESSADLSLSERSKVLERLKKLGWRPRSSARPRRRVTARDPQDRMIRGIWLELADMGAVRDRSESALQAYVRRQTGVAALDWLNGRQAAQVIESLKAWRKRAQRQTEEPES